MLPLIGSLVKIREKIDDALLSGCNKSFFKLNTCKFYCFPSRFTSVSDAQLVSYLVILVADQGDLLTKSTMGLSMTNSSEFLMPVINSGHY